MIFKNAIVRSPGKEIVRGITTQKLGLPDVEKARAQHDNYCNVLHSLGVETIKVDSNENYPDGVFVEDTAVVTKEVAVVTRPGAESRRGEVESVSIALSRFYPDLRFIKDTGTLDGGDVLHMDKYLFIGLTSRTNKQGADQLKEFIEPLGYECIHIPFNLMLHLKSGISSPGQDTILAVKELSDLEVFKRFKKIIVPEDEAYAANSIAVNGMVLVPEGYPKTREVLEKAGFATTAVDVSEFRKVDGGLSCLSIRF